MAFELWFVPTGQVELAWWTAYDTFPDLLAALVARMALGPKKHELRVYCSEGVTIEQRAELIKLGLIEVPMMPRSESPDDDPD